MNQIERLFLQQLVGWPGSQQGAQSSRLTQTSPAWQAATPGLVVQAFHVGKKIVDLEVGETFRFYDWASLTKIIFTTTALMFLHDEKCFSINDRVSRFVEWWPSEDRTRLRDLLSHSAALTWWHPFYQDLSQNLNTKATPEEAWQLMRGLLSRKVRADIRKHVKASSKVRQPLQKSTYSDLDFFVLGEVLTAITGSTLENSWQTVRDRLGFDDVDFNRGNRALYPKKLYAPTEKDLGWRGKTMRGEVHDENTWALKGIAPHSGLFGPIEGLSRYGLLLRKAMRGQLSGGRKSTVFATHETVLLFTKRAIPVARGDWALGFMMPTRGSASCGPLFSTQAVGHTGFTGTSIWYDPKADLLITVLSNRVHPTRDNRGFISLRPKLHTWIAEAII
jgi:CubicO group peptidase (beta-lactamase class C family)